MKYPMGEIAREALDRIITLYGKKMKIGNVS